MSDKKRDIEEIKAEITALIREAGDQGISINCIRAQFIETTEGKFHVTLIDLEERRRV